MEAATAAAQDPPHRRAPARASTSDAGGAAAYAAEFIGTFSLVFFVVAVLSVYSGSGLGYQDFTVIGLVHVFILFLMITALGGASGAHFNPAVTIALLVGRKIRPNDAVVYIVVQMLGALAGTFLAKLLLDNEGDAINYGALAVSDAAAAPAAAPGQPAPAAGPDFLGGSVLGGRAVEALGTFFLMWAIMATAVNPRGNKHWAPLVIGATLGLCVMVMGPLTGAGFNPARWFGPAVAGGEFGDFWVFILGPIIGAVLAYMAYTAVVLNPQDRDPGERPIDTLD